MIKHLQGSVVLLAPYREQTAEVYYFLLVVVVVMWGGGGGVAGENENSEANERSTGLLQKKDRML